MNKQLEIRKTADGSNTIYLPELNENYHSFHGAIQEANHVFIKNGLEQFASRKELSIFELGFGTGLNALLSCLWAEKNKIIIRYTGVEAFPVPIVVCEKMEYPAQLDRHSSKIYDEIIQASWGKMNDLSAFIKFLKTHDSIQNWSNDEKFDIIYFDAFGPQVQPEMWDLPILEKMYESLNENGILVTYCAQGQFRRNLKSLGFLVESLPGPPGKREMTRALKN